MAGCIYSECCAGDTTKIINKMQSERWSPLSPYNTKGTYGIVKLSPHHWLKKGRTRRRTRRMKMKTRGCNADEGKECKCKEEVEDENKVVEDNNEK